MPLKINGTDIAEAYDLEVATDKTDPRSRAFSNYEYIKPFLDFTNVSVEKVQKNDTPVMFCRKGGRPTFTNSYDLSSKFFSGYGAIWIYRSENGEYYTRNSSGDTLIPEIPSTQDILIFEIIGGGGGGSGGTSLLCGVGGGSGGYAVTAVDFKTSRGENNTLYCVIGRGGEGATGGTYRGTGKSGGNSSLQLGGESLICGGGRGASDGTPGNGGTVTIPSAFVALYQADGYTGGRGVVDGGTESDAISVFVGYPTEGDDYRINRGGYEVKGSLSGAGTGACSQFGRGGEDGTSSSRNGGDAPSTARGAGGGGGYRNLGSSSNGGRGANGRIIIHW